MLLNWGEIEYNIDHILVQEFGLQYDDRKARILLELAFGKKIDFLAEISLITGTEFQIIKKFAAHRNKLFHGKNPFRRENPFYMTLNESEKEGIMDNAMHATQIVFEIGMRSWGTRSIVDLRGYIQRLNADIAEPHALATLDALSREICTKLESVPMFTRHDQQGTPLQFAAENRLWGTALIVSAWLGWILKSKSILHYGRSHPEEEVLLSQHVIPSILNAFNQGINEATSNKSSQGVTA